MSIPQRYIENYFKRFALAETILKEPIDSSCGIIIVIPCHNEPDLIQTLASLKECTPLAYQVEVVIVVNDKEGCEGSEIRIQNKKTIEEFEQWKHNTLVNGLKFHLIKALDMPKKFAGVGLARKTGMDEALRRFTSINKDGAIVCLDADCTVSKSYLSAIDKEFVQSKAGLGEMRYEHFFQNEKEEILRDGIINYELFLRYYVAGLNQAGFPYAIQTIGSCMLVKASTYAKHGGMNKRKAGEDFYFLHKIIPHEEFIEVNDGIVFPSCRTSDRVPFGTGKAQQDWIDQENKQYLTYDPRVFGELKTLMDSVNSFYEKQVNEIIVTLPEISRTFIDTYDFSSKIELIKSNCKTLNQFRKQFFIWFDGFLCMKFVHFVRDCLYPNIPILEAIEMCSFQKSSRVVELISSLESTGQ